MLIFILGYMGSGKTTLGKELASRLGYRFFDLDEMIEIATGYSIDVYFDRYGEIAFRQKEKELLTNCLEERDAVIATGGGTPCYADNMELMNRNGLTVYLQAGVDTILQRLHGKILHRPLLKNIATEDLPIFIRDHLDSRMTYYGTAKLRLDAENLELDQLLDAVRSFGG